jgi:hypothetical protein
MKKWGYYFVNDEATKRISASQVIYKDDTEGGWRDINYYPRKNGTGGVMHAKISTKGNKFFAFNDTKDKEEWERTGGGESQTHYLFKMALLELSETTLKFKGTTLTDTKIKLSNAVDEYATGQYFIDVFCDFESDNRLDEKWSGRLGIELCVTNPVERPKKDYLMQHEIPVVQHKISPKLYYNGPKDKEDPIEERKYIDFIKNKMQGFMAVSIISDPSSKLFKLIEKNSQLTQKNEELKEKVSSIEHKVNSANKRESHLTQKVSDKEYDIEIMSTKITNANTRINELEDSIKTYRFIEWVYLVVIFTFLGLTAIGFFKGFIQIE